MNEKLEIVDTSRVLTEDELQELKKLVAMSKMARVAFAMILGAISLVGIDHLVTWVNALNHSGQK